MPIPLKATAAALFAVLAATVARAEATVPPGHLTIGYEREGKIDTSPAACVALVKEITEWSKAETEKGAQQVCAARKRHVDAYQALQTNYQKLMKLVLQDRRLNAPDAAAKLASMVKDCIDHKFGLTTGGHNIMIDVIENDIDAECLTLAANLLRDEIKEFTSR